MAVSLTSTQYINIGSNPTLDNVNTGTLLVWCNPNSADQTGRFWSKGATNFHYCTTTTAASGQLETGVFRATSHCASRCQVASASTYGAGKWCFLAFVWDATGTNGDQHIYHGDLTTPAAEVSAYLDQLVGSGTVGDDSGEDGYLGNSAAATIGFPGRLATMALFNRTLRLPEIQSWQYRPRTMSGCVGFYHLGLHGLGIQPDWSGNGNHGTLSAGTLVDHVPLRSMTARR